MFSKTCGVNILIVTEMYILYIPKLYVLASLSQY